MTEELLHAWRDAEKESRNSDLSGEGRNAAESAAREAHDRYRDRIDSLDEAARALGSNRAAEPA
ncbi:MAG: hypothetical protein QOF49_1275 [Chloroflexota bacterium]|jgi:membrane protein required for beta-lactamase induction|nr:hypothetical protein [Chloroflexota bacterium]